MKKNINKNFKTRHKTLSFFGRSQYRDWTVVLYVFFTIFIFTVFFAIFSYFEIKNKANYFGIDPDLVVVSEKRINKEALTSMIDKMGEREKNFNQLKNSKPKVEDPSI
jgi:hypothetical protein